MIGKLATTLLLMLIPLVCVGQSFNLTGRLVSNGGLTLYDSVGVFAFVQLDLVSGAYRGRLDCDQTRIAVLDHAVEATVSVIEGEPAEPCQRSQSFDVGKLAAGPWEFRIHETATGKTTIARFDVAPRGVVCNAEPDTRQVQLTLWTADATEFLDRLEADPTWRVSLGNLTPGPVEVNPYGAAYLVALLDPLVDPFPVIDALRRLPYFSTVVWFPAGCHIGLCSVSTVGEATEFRRIDRDRYIFVTDPVERDALDAGAIAGWTRTGESMRVIIPFGTPAVQDGVLHPVYRFWGGSVTHEPSHFFTASQTECAVLRDRKAWNWTFERSGFWAHEWKPTGCPSGIPLYRTYNNSLDGAPAHRYSTKRSVIDDMIARGWVDEGPVMCVAGP